jgi:hypothetical protein
MIKKTRYNKGFLSFKNIHAGKTGVLIAPGPSLCRWTSDSNTINVGLSWVVNRPDIVNDLKYFFFGSGYHYTYAFGSCKDGDEVYREKINNLPDTIQKFASSYRNSELTGYGNITPDSAIEINAIPFDCQTPNNNSVFTKDIDDNMILGMTIVFPAIQFMLYTGLNKIFLVGCDHGGNFLNKWYEFKNFADIEYPDTRIISINPVALKGLFIDEYT